ncbi:MAG: hypothetical protein Q4F57_09760 [Weeksellaceae bacterium]|nr:hypothetical protein [Weeksellaceae bacterium]
MIEYIFCIGTGRTGSEYLAKMLGMCKGIQAFHEPQPILNGAHMMEYLRGHSQLLEAEMPNKVKSIEQLRNDEVYVETSHVFIKSFGWLLPEYIPQEKIGVILLNRKPSKVVHSYMRIRSTPLNTGRAWQMTPLKKEILVKKKGVNPATYNFHRKIQRVTRSRIFRKFFGEKTPGFLAYYERKLLFWYIEETEAMAQKYQERFPEISYFSVNIDELNRADTFEKMLNHFGIDFQPTEEFYQALGRVTNLKSHRGK